MTVTLPVALPAVDTRGLTTIAERTVERVAAQAITELDNVGGSARRVFGVALGASDLDQSAQVTAHVSGDRTSLEVHLSVSYPASVARTTQNARDHLTRRVEELTGLVVSRVDINVAALVGATASTASRRVQ
jgi:uncharacterized alkaline shock family protein YloU